MPTHPPCHCPHMMPCRPTHLVSGILVANAHRVHVTSSEAFILRLYRAENRTGFIKAVSDVPEALSRGLFKLDKTMKALWVTKVHLWPRFQRAVTESLAQHPPEVIECRVKPTLKALAIQNAIRELMDSCLKELKRAVPHLDMTGATVQNTLFEGFFQQLKSQLDPIWHTLSQGTKQKVTDIRTPVENPPLQPRICLRTLMDCVAPF